MDRTLRSYLAGGSLLALSFIYWGSFADNIRSPKLVVFVALAGLGGAYLIASRWNLLLGCNFGLCVLSAAWSGLGIQFQLGNVAFLSAALASCYFVEHLESHQVKRIFIFLILAGVGNAVMGYLQIMDRDPIFLYAPETNRWLPSGFLGQQTLLGPFLASCAVAALFCQWYIAALFIAPVVLATQSSFSILSLCAGVFIWVLYQFGKRAAVFMALGGLAFLCSGFLCHTSWTMVCTPDADWLNPGYRFENWGYIFWTAMKAPWFGYGFGTYAHLYQYVQPAELAALTGRYDKAHNDLLQHFFETGVVGILFFLCLFFDVCRKAWMKREDPIIVGAFSIVIVILADSLGNFPFRLVPQGVIGLWMTMIILTHKESVWHN